MSVQALILAAGKGTRMKSPRSKVLQTLLGESMVSLVLSTLAGLEGIDNIVTLVGWQADAVSAEAEKAAKRCGIRTACVEQKEQKGTGHALMTAMPALEGNGRLLVVNGDVPLITAATLQNFLRDAEGADIAFLSLMLDDAGAYGRVIRKNDEVAAIVEAKDFNPSIYGPLADAHEINTGIYLFSLPAVRQLLPSLSNNNASGEYYITDLIALGLESGMDVRGIRADGSSAEELLGVNSPLELASSEETLRLRRIRELLSSGVLLHGTENLRISPFSVIEPGAELFAPCEVYGSTFIGTGSIIRSHCVLRNAVIDQNVDVKEYSHIEEARVLPGALVGPFARLRTGTLVDENAHVGDFVELKKTHLGKGSKANHLTYLGDAEIGEGVNFGAGTITCNYDGINKHKTNIGSKCFIGSNTSLVAPLNIGEGALIGAGSVIVDNVPEGTLALGRGRQVIKKRKA